MPNMFVWTLDDFGASSLGVLLNGTFVISGTPDTARLSDDDANFDDFFGNGGQTRDPGLNQLLTADLVLDGVTVGVTGDGIYNAAEGQIVNNTTGETGRIIYITINGGSASQFVGVATTIPIEAGDSVTTSALTPFATEPYTDIIACFTPGARIRAAQGDVPVEALQVGDLVMTKDDGPQPIRWIGRRYVNHGRLEATSGLRPVKIGAGSMGLNLPQRDMTVSPQHRMLLSGPQVGLNTGFEEVLIPAGAMTDRDGIETTVPEEGIDYIHILFDRHQIIYCEGVETESFHPFVLSKANPEHDPIVDELLAIFPDLRDDPLGYGDTARPCLRMKEARLIYTLETPNVATSQETLAHPKRTSNKCVA